MRLARVLQVPAVHTKRRSGLCPAYLSDRFGHLSTGEVSLHSVCTLLPTSPASKSVAQQRRLRPADHIINPEREVPGEPAALASLRTRDHPNKYNPREKACCTHRQEHWWYIPARRQVIHFSVRSLLRTTERGAASTPPPNKHTTLSAMLVYTWTISSSAAHIARSVIY